MYSAFQWQQTYCSNATYILKTDTDTIVDLNNLIFWIKHEFSLVTKKFPAAAFGYSWSNSVVVRDSKNQWYFTLNLLRFFTITN